MIEALAAPWRTVGLGYAERGLTSRGGGRQEERAVATDIVTGVNSAFDQMVEGQRARRAVGWRPGRGGTTLRSTPWTLALLLTKTGGWEDAPFHVERC